MFALDLFHNFLYYFFYDFLKEAAFGFSVGLDGIAVCAVIAGVIALCFEGFVHAALVEHLGAGQSVAVLIQMIAAAVLSPVYLFAITKLCGLSLCLGKVLCGGGVVVDGSCACDEQSNSCYYGYDLLGLLIKILVPEQEYSSFPLWNHW